jgi:outer membrane protein OmpA-like peptidoglycan-associated protein
MEAYGANANQNRECIMTVQRSRWRNYCVAMTVSVLSAVAAAGNGWAQSGLTEQEMFDRLKAQFEQGRGIGVSDGRTTGTGDADVSVETNYGSGPTPLSPSEPAVYDRDITIDLRVTFETNSAFIRPSAVEELGKLCRAMQSAPASWNFNIIGHADVSGSPAINRPLSGARAKEVARHLERKCGIEGSRFATFGLGSSRLLPGVPPVSEENRRVEVSIVQP